MLSCLLVFWCFQWPFLRLYGIQEPASVYLWRVVLVLPVALPATLRHTGARLCLLVTCCSGASSGPSCDSTAYRSPPLSTCDVLFWCFQWPFLRLYGIQEPASVYLWRVVPVLPVALPATLRHTGARLCLLVTCCSGASSGPSCDSTAYRSPPPSTCDVLFWCFQWPFLRLYGIQEPASVYLWRVVLVLPVALPATLRHTGARLCLLVMCCSGASSGPSCDSTAYRSPPLSTCDVLFLCFQWPFLRLYGIQEPASVYLWRVVPVLPVALPATLRHTGAHLCLLVTCCSGASSGPSCDSTAYRSPPLSTCDVLFLCFQWPFLRLYGIQEPASVYLWRVVLVLPVALPATLRHTGACLCLLVTCCSGASSGPSCDSTAYRSLPLSTCDVLFRCFQWPFLRLYGIQEPASVYLWRVVLVLPVALPATIRHTGARLCLLVTCCSCASSGPSCDSTAYRSPPLSTCDVLFRCFQWPFLRLYGIQEPASVYLWRVVLVLPVALPATLRHTGARLCLLVTCCSCASSGPSCDSTAYRSPPLSPSPSSMACLTSTCCSSFDSGSRPGRPCIMCFMATVRWVLAGNHRWGDHTQGVIEYTRDYCDRYICYTP